MTTTREDLRETLAMAGLLLLGQGKERSLFGLRIALQLGYSKHPVIAEELGPFLRRIAGIDMLATINREEREVA